MMTTFQAILMGALQGLSELFPVSSLGHSVILPSLIGWDIDQSTEAFLLFLVATHLATALVLFAFYWKDWMGILDGLWRTAKAGKLLGDTYARLAYVLILGTVPAGLLGLLLEKRLKEQLSIPRFAAAVLIANGVLLFLAERLRKKAAYAETHDDARIAKLSWAQTLKVGLLQCLALIPGFSRTGSTITGGLLAGLTHEDAARFSFLLATPIIGAAALLKLPKLLKAGAAVSVPILAGTLASAIAAYLTVRFLSKYFRTKTLKPFATYCIVAGLVFSIILALR